MYTGTKYWIIRLLQTDDNLKNHWKLPIKKLESFSDDQINLLKFWLDKNKFIKLNKFFAENHFERIINPVSTDEYF